MFTHFHVWKKLFQAKLSRYIVTWVFTSLVVVEIAILIPSYLRRENELLSKLENVSNEVFSDFVYKVEQGEHPQEMLNMTTRKLKPESVIRGVILYQADGKLIKKVGETPEISYQDVVNSQVLRLRSEDKRRYDVVFFIPKNQKSYILIVRHNSENVQKELYAYSLRIAALVLLISGFVTLTTMLTLGVAVIQPILLLRDDLLAAGEAIIKNGEDPNFQTLSISKQDEMGEVIAAFREMFMRVRKEIKDRETAEVSLREEKQKSDSLLLNILPSEIAQQLKQEQSAIANRFDEVTILFADIVNFTGLSTQISPIELVNSLNEIFSEFDKLAEFYGLEKIKTIGDAYMVVGGLPTPRSDHAIAVAKMALEMQRSICKFKTPHGECFQLRIGINTGSVVAGVIGLKKFSYDLWGDAVNVASRMESHGVVGKIQVSEITYFYLQDHFQLEKRGEIKVKGRGMMTTYFLLSH
ncbi:MAG: adenylate/guanylate cyclase domain-containing protein [Nostocales cyanobacterium]|nr:MAG: adenylate/guanylate cyclase domain-containing protein [Nostocales cyanobacterium]TAF08987.1 MAG: adenylate/guanylate cyclase domain-containing protein [Nostocales cyanobacterium]